MSGRFAPSPTGDLHLGNLRTALVAWLSARSRDVGFLVRMEDLDRVTSSRGHAARQLADLDRIGLHHDGEVVFQSERFGLYESALDRLRARDLVYPCWCTRREILEAASAPHGGGGMYPGTCRDLDEVGRDQRARQVRAALGDRPPALRLDAQRARANLGADADLAVVDRVLGIIDAPVDDVVLRRNDGVPAYHLAVVVDDALQGVDEVVRGQDLAAVTTTQVLIARTLGLPVPRYAHVPLVLGPDGERLAKRHGAVTLDAMAARGVTPLEVLGRLLVSMGLDPVPRMEDLSRRARDFRWPQVAGSLEPWVVGDP